MNHVIARVRERGNNKYRKLLSGTTLYNKPNIEEIVDYSPSVVLEEGQWFVISDFTSHNYYNGLIVEDWDSTRFSSDKIDINRIEYICSYQDEDEFYFQRVYKSCIIKNRVFLTLGDSVSVEEPNTKIVINMVPDAMYIKSKNQLFFRKLETITNMFNGIEELYKEATSNEVESFLNQSFIQTGDGFTFENVGKLNRHRMALASKTLNTLNEKNKKELFEYASQYYPELNYQKGVFRLESDNDLKKLLYGIEQRLYTTPITKEKRVATSIIKID